VQDEANVRSLDAQRARTAVRRLRRAVLDGDWPEMEKLVPRAIAGAREQKVFLYAAYRLQFLELLDGGEQHKAFTQLTKRLKPLESCAPSPAEFRDLCYLLTCRSVHEVVRDWEGAAAARESLLLQHEVLLELQQPEAAEEGEALLGAVLPRARLLQLLQQAAEWQVESARRRVIRSNASAPSASAASAATTAASAASAVAPADTSAAPSSAATSSAATSAATPAATSAATTARAPFGGAESPPHLSSLLCDYALPLLPNRARLCLRGHSGGVKSVAWLQVGGGGGGGGGEMQLAVATNSEQVRLFDLADMGCRLLLGHADIVLALDASAGGGLIASASKDATVRLWDPATAQCVGRCVGHMDAVGAVGFGGKTGGRLAAGAADGPPLPATLLSASKDKTLKKWDLSPLLAGGGGGKKTKKKDPTAASGEEAPTLSCLATVRAHPKEVNALAVAPNDRLAITGSQDRSLKANTDDPRVPESARDCARLREIARDYASLCEITCDSHLP